MSAPDWLFAQPIAHRGLHDREAGLVENSLSAADAAVAGGYAVECDVQLSADGEAVVFHDDTLERLTGAAGPVGGQDAAALGTLRLTGSEDTIPTLAALLDRIRGRVPVVVEIKSRFDGDERLARRTAEILSGAAAPVAAKSFDPAIVSLLRRIAPTLRRGIVAQAQYEGGEWDRLDASLRRTMAGLRHWNDTRPDFISYRHRDLPRQSQATLMPRILDGVPLMTWTIRSQAEADSASPFCDQIVFEGFRPGSSAAR